MFANNLGGARYKRCIIGIEEHCGVPFDFPDSPDRPGIAHFVHVSQLPADSESLRIKISDIPCYHDSVYRNTSSKHRGSRTPSTA